MKFLETYKPKKNEIIYHYCDTHSFQAIFEIKTIRLSDLFSMNDQTELAWGYSIWEEVANLSLKEFGNEFIAEIDKRLHSYGAHSLIISSSYSSKSDVLSQWRAYASDGNGFCIGFNAQELFCLPVNPIKIIYKQKSTIRESRGYCSIYLRIRKIKRS